ncbi:DUF4382 domain-containing protein [Winogradskyella algicola]|uniref:DUF4382 domain-containing protein n=1 Tax=Winogradskyella algicola TaxID=2575815 RepID=UPI0011094456|nr:DUF4382 domain-containing protein [Winogradskyella algicola]
MKQFQSIKTLCLLTVVLTMSSCTKDDVEDSTQSTQITVKLKSSNQSQSKVYFDIQDVQIRIGDNPNSTSSWKSLNTINQGVFNVSDLEEDNKLLLVDDFEVETTYVYEIRLVLGDNNFMDINHVLHSLDLGNAKPSNLIETQLNSKRRYDVVIDIDLDKSVFYNEDENMMILNPKLYTAIRQIEY